MAVTGTFAPNLSSSYNNIQQALEQAATIQSKNTGGMGAAAAVAAPIAELSKERNDLMFKAALQDHLEKNKYSYAAQAEGKTLRTQDDFDSLATQYGADPTKVKGLIPKEGVWTTPQQENDLLGTLGRSQKIETIAQGMDAKGDSTKANFIRLMGRSNDPNADQYIARAMGFSQLKTRINPATGNLEAYDPANPMIGIPMNGATGTTDHSSATPTIKDIPSLRRVDKRQADALDAAGKASMTDSLLKTHSTSLDELGQVEKLVKANVAGSQVNIGADAARAIGGVPGGRFSSLLSQKEGKDPSLLGRFGQGYQTITSGNLTENNQKLLLQEIAVAKQQKQSELMASIEDKVNLAKVDSPYASDGLIRDKIAGGYKRYLAPPDQPKVPEIKSQADYDALKSGDQYMWKGQTLTKK